MRIFTTSSGKVLPSNKEESKFTNYKIMHEHIRIFIRVLAELKTFLVIIIFIK